MASQREKEDAYMNTGSTMKSAIEEYVTAARDIGMSDHSIATDVADSLAESDIRISSALMDE